MRTGRPATCDCGECAKCRRRVCMRAARAKRRAMLDRLAAETPWSKSVHMFTLEHMGYGQSSLYEVARNAKRLIKRSRRLRMRVFMALPVEGRPC